MRREALSFAVLALLLSLLFIWSRGEWRQWRGKFLIAGPDSTAGQGAGEAEARAALKEYLQNVRESGMAERLERISDSLSAVIQDLDSQRDRLQRASTQVRNPGPEVDERFEVAFFHAEQAFQELDRAVGSALTETDSIGFTLLGQSKGRNPARAAIIRWNTPSRVGVREACLSCHQPLPDGRVRLTLDEDEPGYPQPMLQHPPEEFGCTVCHRGEAAELNFNKAHGDDFQGRPFRPGKLALRSCGLCHGPTPAQSASLPLEWPDDCLGCHSEQSLGQVANDSLFSHFSRDAVRSERDLRKWLLKHWAIKTGQIPGQEAFETAETKLLNGDSHRMKDNMPASLDSTRTGIAPCTELVCPSCKRRFKVTGGLSRYFCPLDGTGLEPLRGE